MKMNNPFPGMFGGNQMQGVHPLVQQFQRFQQGFKGNADQQIQQMMNSGKINQQQYDKAVQMAKQFRNILGVK